jgi:hypothetical protein
LCEKICLRNPKPEVATISKKSYKEKNMKEKTDKILAIWHEHFSDEENQYSEFEPSDIEYFVGCMLYNHFAFTKALENLKTMDLSYDFLSACGDEYDEIQRIIKEIEFESETESLAFLQSFIAESRAKYTPSELYLLNRLHNHIATLADIYSGSIDVNPVDFQNPLYR